MGSVCTTIALYWVELELLCAIAHCCSAVVGELPWVVVMGQERRLALVVIWDSSKGCGSVAQLCPLTEPPLVTAMGFTTGVQGLYYLSEKKGSKVIEHGYLTLAATVPLPFRYSCFNFPVACLIQDFY